MARPVRRKKATSRGVTETDGQRRLRKWLDSDGDNRTQTAIAASLGISQAAVSQWVKGTCRPEAHLRTGLERLTGIPVNDWLTPDERRIAYPRTG